MNSGIEKRFEGPEKRYINAVHYYFNHMSFKYLFYYFLTYSFSLFILNVKNWRHVCSIMAGIKSSCDDPEWWMDGWIFYPQSEPTPKGEKINLKGYEATD